MKQITLKITHSASNGEICSKPGGGVGVGCLKGCVKGGGEKEKYSVSKGVPISSGAYSGRETQMSELPWPQTTHSRDLMAERQVLTSTS
jgi:hypothetical protein